jgi:hypothetical protein
MAETVIVCNKENGSFSQLWGRDCWVADSVLSLVYTHADLLYEQSTDENVDAALKKIMSYCEELREKNKEYWYEEIGTEP